MFQAREPSIIRPIPRYSSSPALFAPASPPLQYNLDVSDPPRQSTPVALSSGIKWSRPSDTSVYDTAFASSFLPRPLVTPTHHPRVRFQSPLLDMERRAGTSCSDPFIDFYADENEMTAIDTLSLAREDDEPVYQLENQENQSPRSDAIQDISISGGSDSELTAVELEQLCAADEKWLYEYEDEDDVTI